MVKILIVRRDNIGDLICTLPLIAEVRKNNPEARLDLLVNTYNQAIVAGNPNVDHIYSYTKDKHRSVYQGWFANYAKRFFLTLHLFFVRYDYVVLANVGVSTRSLRWARFIRPLRVVGLIQTGDIPPPILNWPIFFDRSQNHHEVEYLMQLAKPFGGFELISPPRIIPEPASLAWANSILGPKGAKPILGINISARLPSQQWSSRNWVNLIKKLSANFRCIIFWSPGASTNKLHPGDDEKAELILSESSGCDVIGFPTQTLADLIAGISLTDVVVTPDGGAMHISAACGKPIVALFGDSNASQWHPWGVPHHVLQTSGRDVNQISVDTVIEACDSLTNKLNKSV